MQAELKQLIPKHMKPSDFIHPEDAAALKTVDSIPGVAAVFKSIWDLGTEQMQTGINLASKIRLSPRQLPHLYNLLPPICEELGIKEPDFFLQMNPIPNAFAFGDTQTAITLTSGIVDLMTEDELRAVVAHECGHILCHHMLYHSIALTMIQNAVKLNLLKKMTKPVLYALLYWMRKSEFSCDRVAAYITNPQTTASMLARLAGGPKHLTEQLDLVELVGQADEYDALYKKGFWNKSLQTYAILGHDHPFSCVRIREMLLWVDSDEYKQLVAQNKKRCPNCGKEIKNEWQFCQHCGHKLQ